MSDRPAHAPPRSRRPDRLDHRGDFGLAFRWLLIGAVTYAATLAIAVYTDPELALVPIVGPSLYLTPVFGTPYVVMSFHRRGRTRRLIFFLALLPLAHIAANYVAWSWAAAHYRPWPDGHEFARRVTFGAFGGVTGATLSFTGLLLLGLVPRRKPWLWKAAAGTVVLGAIGAAGMAWGLEWSDALDGYAPGPMVLWFECVHLPWQVALAFFLAWMLRIPPKRRWRAANAAVDSPG